MRLVGLSLGPEDPCYDPQHPTLLPNFLHDAYECQCMADNSYPVDSQCVFAMPGGTPTNYVRPDKVPSVLQAAASTPGYIAGNVVGGIVGGAAKGAADSTGLNETIITAAVIIGGIFLLQGFLKR